MSRIPSPESDLELKLEVELVVELSTIGTGIGIL